MRKTTAIVPVSSEGFLLLNSSFNPIFVNRAATEILTYPQKPETQTNLEGFLASKIHSLFPVQPSRVPTLVAKFQSGRRHYQCRAYRVNALAKENSQPSVAVVLERDSRGPIPLSQVSERFRLTTREREVFLHVSNGHTTKEIAVGMGISPNTVKFFLHGIMDKMGVSTRSGIVGKALTQDFEL
jgi:DNA-binding CsgD family transcriptional regulator